MSVGVLDHFNIRTRKLADTVRFYEDILGLENGDRPNFAFPGAWMYSEGKPVVHLVDISPTEEQQKPDSGVVHDLAFVSRDFSGMKRRLQSTGIAFDGAGLNGRYVVLPRGSDVAQEWYPFPQDRSMCRLQTRMPGDTP